MIAANHALLFERADAAQAGRGGQPDAGRQFDVGHPSFGLQQGKDFTVDRIELDRALRAHGSDRLLGEVSRGL
jgi:hypothetical protein